MMTKSLFAVAALAASLALPTACSSQSNATQPASKDIVQTAVDAGTFNTLVAAVKAAGLVETLKGEGPFTVFAPTDAAFAKLPAGTVEALLADPKKLASILTFHVVPGKVMAADVVKANGAKPKTVNGQSLDVVVRDGRVLVNGASVVTADVVASNGVIHVIDTVLLRPHPRRSASSRIAERRAEEARRSGVAVPGVSLFPEARLVRLVRDLLPPHPGERPLTGVPPEDGVVVAGLTKLLGLLERLHRRAQRRERHRLGVHRPLVSCACARRSAMIPSSRRAGRVGHALERLARASHELTRLAPELVRDREGQHHEHRLVRRVHLENVEADALRRPRLIEQPVALRLLDRAGDGFFEIFLRSGIGCS
jgi:uncharacterized surface protein with fasciclin (FAS1) repeats